MLITTDDRDRLNLKERHTETLRELLEEKTPSYGCCGGIRDPPDTTALRPVLLHRPEAGRTRVRSDLHLGDTEVMEYCRGPLGDADARRPPEARRPRLARPDAGPGAAPTAGPPSTDADGSPPAPRTR